MCDVTYRRTHLGKHVYVDETNRRWSGKFCFECAKIRNKAWHSGAEHPNKQVGANPVQDQIVRIKQPPRFCRKCTTKLPANKYFYHETCRPVIEYIDWSEVNHIHSSQLSSVGAKAG